MNSQEAESLLGRQQNSQPVNQQMLDTNQLFDKSINDVLNKRVTDETLRSFTAWSVLENKANEMAYMAKQATKQAIPAVGQALSIPFAGGAEQLNTPTYKAADMASSFIGGIPASQAITNTGNLITNPKQEITRRANEYASLTPEQKREQLTGMVMGTFGGGGKKLYHGSDFVETINKEGFKLGGKSERSVGASTNIDRLGKGIYFADNPEDASRYARSWDIKDVVESQIKPNVKIKQFDDYQQWYDYVNKFNPKAFEKPELLNALFEKQGYGGVSLAGDTVVFNPKNIIVIKSLKSK
jgi:hypothetical protein